MRAASSTTRETCLDSASARSLFAVNWETLRAQIMGTYRSEYKRSACVRTFEKRICHSWLEEHIRLRVHDIQSVLTMRHCFSVRNIIEIFQSL